MADMKKIFELDQPGENFIDERIPSHMREGLRSYLYYGVRPGDFLSAVLANDLVNAVSHADEINKHHLFGYASFMYWHMPARSYEDSPWGSYEAIEAHIKRGIESRQVEEIDT